MHGGSRKRPNGTYRVAGSISGLRYQFWFERRSQNQDLCKDSKKVLYARAGVEFRRYSEDNTSRYAAKGSTVAFRTGLDVGSKSTSVANSIMLESKK